jgi:hypothetical protein
MFECVTELHIPTSGVYHWPDKREPDRENRKCVLRAASRVQYIGHMTSRNYNEW